MLVRMVMRPQLSPLNESLLFQLLNIMYNSDGVGFIYGFVFMLFPSVSHECCLCLLVCFLFLCWSFPVMKFHLSRPKKRRRVW
ncbi:unnamed protein product, partial [Prunus brigantina]